MQFKKMELYEILLQYLCFVKRLELQIKISHDLKEDSLFREIVVTKDFPHTGEIHLNGVKYRYRFHGSGITYQSEAHRIHYIYNSQMGLGVAFNDLEIKNFILQHNIKTNLEASDVTEVLMELKHSKLLHQLLEDYCVFIII